MAAGIDKILEVYQRVNDEGCVAPQGQPFNSYAVTSLRGGVGKSSIAFNLAYEISRKHSLLVADLSPQCSLTEMLLGEFRPKVDIYSALLPAVLGPASGDPPEDLTYRISQYCDSFKGGKLAHAIPGNMALFAFPSTLYQQLNAAHAGHDKAAMKRLLFGLKTILEKEAKLNKSSTILLDTSPFYAGETHLAWCAVEALIVPVRGDERSLESLELLFNQLSDPARDFCQWNERAGGLPAPKISAIVMTMVGAFGTRQAAPDKASLMYIERALGLAELYAPLLGHDDPSDALVLTDDFHSAGRISGAKRIPIAELKVRSFHNVENRRLQVNASAERYQKQLKYLASMI